MNPFPDVHAVIDARAVSTVFQPLTRLADGVVVGYEALSRGPAGTRWEMPEALFAAARRAGRESELDWICRAHAYRAALGAGFPRNLACFVNMEPRAWRVPCPADLRGYVDAARDRLSVVTEMTEGAIADDPPALLAATAASRAAGWGVAVDDVGAVPEALALMPFVHPDVVKLDMRLLRAPAERHTAQVVTAVLAYAESTGATILAEGIETAHQLAVARSMGATVGQGWHFGRPGPLPPAPAAPAVPLGPVAGAGGAPAEDPGATPYSIVAARRPVTRIEKNRLMPLSRYLESQALAAEDPPVLLACFQDDRFFTARTAERFTRIARRSPLVAAVAAGLTDEPAPGVRGARLAPDDPLRGEWNVIVVGPHYAAALVARDAGDSGRDAGRRFDYVVTHDRPLVIRAARSLLRCLTPLGEPAPLAAAR